MNRGCRRGPEKMAARSCDFSCIMEPSSSVHLLVVLLLLLAAPPASALTPDGVLLLSFKYGITNDPLSVLSSWNYNDDSPCNWNGVSCSTFPGENSNLRVVSLFLPNSRLLGAVAGDLGLIQHLQQLDLSGNSLSGPLPSSIFVRHSGGPSELRRVSLAGNEISGRIPELPAGAMANLVLLNLSDNALTGSIPVGFSSLANLTVFSVSGNYITGALPAGGFPGAQYVDLSSNLFNGTIPSGFFSGNSAKLRYLNLSYNRISGEIPAEFAAGIPAGAVVDLAFNNLSGVIPNSKPLLDQSPSAFEGNLALCGQPLKITCPLPSNASDPPRKANVTMAQPDSPPAFAAIPRTVSGGAAQPTGGAGAQRSLKPRTIMAIIAADVGGITLLLLVFFYVYRAKKRRQQEQTAAKQLSPLATGGVAARGGGGGGFSLLCLARRKGRRGGEESDGTSTCYDTDGEFSEQKKPSPIPAPEKNGVLVTVDGEEELELETLLKASAYILGARGSSIMYKAVLADGTALAVRRIGEGGDAAEKLRDFEAQVRGLAKLRHPNLLSIRGFYWGADEKLLIYDYLANGSLANISYRKMGTSPFHLPWENRLRIARGVARALAFLHEKKCVHGNLKPSNILLRHDMEPVVADFAMDRLLAGVSGGAATPSFSARHFGSKRSTLSQSSQQEIPAPPTQAAPTASPCLSCSGAAGDASSCLSPYQAPESLKNLKPNAKWDVYSFGVVLLELLAGRVFTGGELSQWSGGGIADDEGGSRLLRMVDPAIRGDVVGEEETFLSCFKLAFSCGAAVPNKRPSMKEAALLLDRSLPISPLPHHRHDYS